MDLAPDLGNLLKRWHQHNADEPINGCDKAGAWLESYWAQFAPIAFPLVIDANVLRNCVGPTAKRAQRTVLSTLANRRNTRIFCAPHVVKEFYKHLDEWAAEYEVASDVYRAAFEETYLPLLRIVPTDDINEMLMPNERARIAVLQKQDADDIPTAMLALAMGAMPVTMDPRPWEAVYGVKADKTELQEWLTLLMRVGDLTETESLMTGTHMTLGSVLVGGAYGAVALYRLSPIAFAAVAAGIAAALQCIPKPASAKVWDAMRSGFETYNETLAQPHHDATEHLRPQLPPFPNWGILVDATSRDAALGRACLFRLSRTRRLLPRASGLANQLPELAIGQDRMRVGTVLRRYPAFFEPYAMRWQVGLPANFLGPSQAG